MATFLDISEMNALGTGEPIRKLFLEDAIDAFSVKRTTSGLTKTGTGTGDMQPRGNHDHAVNTSYRIVIDLAGDETTATFKWSADGGATYLQEGVLVSAVSRTLLQNNMTVLFALGTYDLADQWDFTAIATGSQFYDLQVDTTNSIVKVGTKLLVANDANFRLHFFTGEPHIYFDASTAIAYYRALDTMDFYIDGASPLQLLAELIKAQKPIQLTSVATPATPTGTPAIFYNDASSRPRWLDSTGEAYPLLPLTTKGDLYTHAVLSPTRLAVGANGYKLEPRSTEGTGLAWTKDYTPIVCIIDGGGQAISTGVKADIPLIEDLTVEGWTLLADQSGSIVLDLWHDTYANYPPTVADTITAADKPTISAADKGQDLAPTGWDTTLDAGSTLRINVDSVSTVTRATLTLHCRRR